MFITDLEEHLKKFLSDINSSDSRRCAGQAVYPYGPENNCAARYRRQARGVSHFMIAGNLHKSWPKSGKPIAGKLTAGGTDILWWDDPSSANGKILAKLNHAEIVNANKFGIVFKGYEPSGTDRQGREVLKYQEWWITPEK